jgi:basic membrane protein A
MRRPVVLASFLIGLSLAVCLGGAGAAGRPLKVALVFPPGANTSFVYRDQIEGLRRAVRLLGVEGRVVTLSPKADWLTRVSSLAAQGYDLIFPPDGASLDAAAGKFPGTRFAFLDEAPHRQANVVGALFRVQEAGYLAGYLAGLVEKLRPGRDMISSVGGIKFSVVDAFIAGYQAGSRKADPGIVTLNAYSQSFGDPAKCKAIALSQIAKGSRAVFNVAGACGLGALEAAKQRGVWGIGVDVDQSQLGPHILTSALANRGVAVFEIIRTFVRGTFRGGQNLVFNVANGGVGLGKISPKVPRALVAKVERIRQQIASGAIRVPAAL